MFPAPSVVKKEANEKKEEPKEEVSFCMLRFWGAFFKYLPHSRSLFGYYDAVGLNFEDTRGEIKGHFCPVRWFLFSSVLRAVMGWPRCQRFSYSSFVCNLNVFCAIHLLRLVVRILVSPPIRFVCFCFVFAAEGSEEEGDD